MNLANETNYAKRETQWMSKSQISKKSHIQRNIFKKCTISDIILHRKKLEYQKNQLGKCEWSVSFDSSTFLSADSVYKHQSAFSSASLSFSSFFPFFFPSVRYSY